MTPPPPSHPSIAILGGGPAGAAAGALLARWGHDVAIVERGGDGGAKSLAESLPPSARKVLAATGLLGVVEAGGFHPNGGNTALWGGEGRRDRFADGATGFHVLRSRFDPIALQAARAAGAAIVRGAARLPVSEDGAWRVAVTLQDGRTVTLRPSWVLDCTGRAGVLARRHRIVESEAPTLAVVRRYRAREGWGNVDDDHALVESFARGWAWSVPTSPTERHVAVMLDPSLHAVMEGADDLSGAFDAEIARTALMKSVAEAAEPASDAWAVAASMYTSSRFAVGNTLLVGDAASFADPMSSYGVKKALSSAWLAAVAVNTAIRTPELAGIAADFFAERERAMYASLREGLAAQVAATRAAAPGAAAGETPGPAASDAPAPPALAAPAPADAFWKARARWLADGDGAEVEPNAPDGPDVESLRDDPEVRGAFHALRLGSGRLRALDRATVDRPLVFGRRIRMVPALATPRFPGGVRFFRDIDLLRVVHLAGGASNPGALYESYSEWAAREDLPPVDLASFIGVLALLIADGVLAPEPRPAVL